MQSPICQYLDRVLRECAHLDGGAVPTGNDVLASADPEVFGVALATVGGSLYTAGDAGTEFSIQSISKALTYALALDDHGLDTVLDVVDVEPSGDSFNEISLEPGTGRPRNALINAGALAVHSMVRAESAIDRVERIRAVHSALAGRELEIDEKVRRAELASDDRNTGIAHLLRAVDKLGADPLDVVEGYAGQCAISANCRDLATIAAVLANGGIDPATGDRLLDARITRHVLATMATCGMYDGSGNWMSSVGIPAKSGVAGAIIGVLPGQVGIAVISPRLNDHGNSVRGVAVFERLSRDLELHMMHTSATGQSAVRSIEQRDDATVFELQGDLRFAGAESILAELTAGFTDGHRIELSFEHVRAVDDAARALLAEVIDRLDADGHRVSVSDPKHLM
ncbi:glutaminase A [Rhodococcoides kyotonense]|nr:glutaminase A [Rhodococcus kyotonensis]